MTKNEIQRLLVTAAASAALLLPACSSAGKKGNVSDGPEVNQLGPYIPPDPPEHKPIGGFLNDLDWTMRQWSKLMLEARTTTQRRRAGMLESNLRHYTRQRLDEIVAELATGPPKNRVIAAGALGFSDSPEAHGPLLAALEDHDDRVVSNALLGLRGLGRPDTPLERVCELLVTSPDAVVRTNAASAARAVVEAHLRAIDERETQLAERELRGEANVPEPAEEPEIDGCIVDAAGGGIVDEDPGLRSQCILLVAALADSESIGDLEGCLHDDIPLVQAAAARALAVIGMTDVENKGRCARALTGALRSADTTMRKRLQRALILLSDAGYEKDEDWIKWARRLP